jgi:uncharacterized protein
MNLQTAHHAVDFIKNIYNCNHTDTVSVVFWGGEPLLNFDIIRYFVENLVDFGRESNVNFLFHLITNGTILNEDMISFFKKYKMTIQISIDGEVDVHDSQRHFISGKGTFKVVKDNIKKLIINQMRDDVYLKSTFTKNNFPLQDTVDFFEKIDMKYHISPALGGCQDNADNYFSSSEIEKEVKIIIDNFFKKIHADISSVNKNKTISLFLKYIFNKRIALYSCSAGVNMFCIDIYGDIYFCHQFALYPTYKVGSIYQDIDFNKFQEFGIRSVNSRDGCRKCGFIYLCGGSCTCHELTNNNRRDEIQCSFVTSMFKSIVINLLKLAKNDKGIYDNLLKNIGVSNNTSIFKVIQMNKTNMRINNDFLFKRSLKTVLYPLDEEGILYLEGEEEKKYIVNITTMAIWDLLDGKRTAQQIAQEIANVCEVEFETIKDDIYGQLAAFQELGLVEEVQAESHA